MPTTRAERLAFQHGDAAPLFAGVDLHLDAGFAGLVGENGAGKSTFLRLVAGELAPTAGRVQILPANALVVHCPQGVEVPGPDVQALALATDGRARRLCGSLRLSPGELQRWDTLSPGERRRWQIGAALALEPDVLLLDEPTNHADGEARALLVAALRLFRGIGVIVSHDRALLDALTTVTWRAHGGAIRAYPGPYGQARPLWEAELRAAWQARADAQERARRAAERLGEARRQQAAADAARRGSRRMKGPRDADARSVTAKTLAEWGEARAGRRVELARREAERAAGGIPEVPPAAEAGRSLFLAFERCPRAWLLALDEPHLSRAGRLILRDVKVRLGREERVRLAGPNGAGKSTLLEALLGAATVPPERLLYLPQELPPGAAAGALAQLRALAPELRGRVLALVAALGVDPARLLASRAPSPGEARKLWLALGMGRQAWGLLLDEPTNHLDLPSVERLEEALAAYPGALLLVSHDEAFAERCTRTTWRIENGKVEPG